MVTEGLQKDLDAYNALISGCAKSRNYDRAMTYFRQMVSPNSLLRRQPAPQGPG